MGLVFSLGISGKFTRKLLAITLVSAGITPLFAQSAIETAKDSLRATPQDEKSFSLVHLRLDEMSASDRALVQSRTNDIRQSALVYGYDLASGEWQVEQGVCPQFADTILLHYLERYPDGTQSLFTVLVPKTSGRVRVIPVLHRNAVPYLASASNPANYELFNSLVSPETAQKDSVAGGQWLPLGVCYAEMVGGKPNVPRDPSLDPATIKAPAPTFHVDASTGQRSIRFPDRDADDVVKMWSISLDAKGRVVAASNEDNSTYTAHVVQPAVEPVKLHPAAPELATKVIVNPPASPSKITPIPPDSPTRIIANPPEPPMKVTPESR